MNKSSPETMELGNMLFGHSRGVYHIEPRMEYQSAFYEFLEANGFDGYGHPADKSDHYENDVFIIRPYYWGDDPDIADLPNFLFKPENIWIKWYKYALRDAYSNFDLTEEKFAEILAKCCEFVENLK